MPDAGVTMMVSQSKVAVHAHPGCVVIVMTPLVPTASTTTDVGEIEYVHVDWAIEVDERRKNAALMHRLESDALTSNVRTLLRG
jgi:hypothetical protein